MLPSRPGGTTVLAAGESTVSTTHDTLESPTSASTQAHRRPGMSGTVLGVRGNLHAHAGTAITPSNLGGVDSPPSVTGSVTSKADRLDLEVVLTQERRDCHRRRTPLRDSVAATYTQAHLHRQVRLQTHLQHHRSLHRTNPRCRNLPPQAAAEPAAVTHHHQGPIRSLESNQSLPMMAPR